MEGRSASNGNLLAMRDYKSLRSGSENQNYNSNNAGLTTSASEVNLSSKLFQKNNLKASLGTVSSSTK